MKRERIQNYSFKITYRCLLSNQLISFVEQFKALSCAEACAQARYNYLIPGNDYSITPLFVAI